jgi:copper homeostasis protein (lipoprotein)
MIKSVTTSFIALTVFILLGCTSSPENKQSSTKVKDKIDSTFSDGHNSSNSLDVEGKYKGILPCADCGGIETEIILSKNNSYVKHTKYLGKDGRVFGMKGFYSWNNEGNTITLSGISNAPNQYLVGENKLIQLDMEGKRISGNLSEKYVLLK